MGLWALRFAVRRAGAAAQRIFEFLITMGLAPLGLGSASGGSSRRAAVWCVCGSGTCDLASDLWRLGGVAYRYRLRRRTLIIVRDADVVTGMLVRFVRMSNDSAMCPRLRFGQQCVRVSLFSPCTVTGSRPRGAVDSGLAAALAAVESVAVSCGFVSLGLGGWL